MRVKSSASIVLASLVLHVPQVVAKPATTAAPTTTTTCVDDPSFLFRNKEGKDCAWVAAKKNVENCCNKNSNGIQVRQYCPIVCDSKCSEYITDAPSTSPTVEAQKYCFNDDPEFNLNGKSKQTCEWAALKPNQRCGRKDEVTKKRVHFYCPSACDRRCTCKNSRKFKLNGKITSCSKTSVGTCSTVTDKGLLVSDYCAKKCGTCFVFPSTSPTIAPSISPSSAPTTSPSATPSASPSDSPSAAPSAPPSASPSVSPSAAPSASPSASPSDFPSSSPSASPSDVPSVSPSDAPSTAPSVSPTLSAAPSASPSFSNAPSSSGAPSASPSLSNAPSTSNAPSASPSDAPSSSPSATPSATPSSAPSASPSVSPSASPSASPSMTPTETPAAATILEADYPDGTTEETVEADFTALATSVARRRLGTTRRLESTVHVVVTKRSCTDPTAGQACFDVFVEWVKKAAAAGVDPNVIKKQLESELDAGTIGDLFKAATGKEPPAITLAISESPSDVPSEAPSATPSVMPSGSPSATPSSIPSMVPSSTPTVGSEAPSTVPSDTPSVSPSEVPSVSPSDSPSNVPSASPSDAPSNAPSKKPSMTPSMAPSMTPSMKPSTKPSMAPSMKPSTKPSMAPTAIPTDAVTGGEELCTGACDGSGNSGNNGEGDAGNNG